jgi:hypothetical protein
MKLNLVLMMSLLISATSFAAKHDGIIVRLKGKAEVLANPSHKPQGPGPHVLLNGKYYTSKKARLGYKVLNGNIIRTDKGTKLRVVYKNGDQINVGSASAYEVSWNPKKEKTDPSTIRLMYGTIRGIVKKNGPRSGVKIKTKSAVMGIRGTDFNIAQNGLSGDTAISVIRGNVDVNILNPKKGSPKKLEVKQGQTAEVITKIVEKKEKKEAKIIQTSKQELVKIQQETTIEKADVDEVEKKVATVIAKLEEASAQTTISDIKQYDKNLYEEIQKKKIKNVDSINTMAIKKVAQKAPLKKGKFDVDSLDLSDDAFDQYFEIKE